MRKVACRLVLCLKEILAYSRRQGAGQPVAPDGAVGWKTLKDGTWSATPTGRWLTVRAADKGAGFLVTPASYRDFQITLEFWVTDDANSGVFLRCSNPKLIDQTNAYEVNIFDKRPDQSYRTGGIVDVAKPTSIIQTGGKGNTYDITAKGSQLTVVLNERRSGT